MIVAPSWEEKRDTALRRSPVAEARRTIKALIGGDYGCSPGSKIFTRCRATDFKSAFNTPNNRDLLWELGRRSLQLEEVRRRRMKPFV